MTEHEHKFWTEVFASEGLDEAAVRNAAVRRGAALAAKKTKGDRSMRARKSLTALTAAIAVCLFAVGAGAAGGLFKTPAETAAILTATDLAAFKDEEEYPTLVKIYSAPDVLTVNEVQADAGYTVTLLAVANEPAADADGTAHTHILYTVARTDGTPLTQEELCREIRAEALVQGYGTAAPYSASEEAWRVQDGVGYMDCRLPDLYPFADRALYLAVRQAWGFADSLGYHAGGDGSITAVADYENLNLLFTLPIGAEHADADAAARAEQSWRYEPTAEEQAALDAAIEKARARDERNAAAAQAAGQPLPEPGGAQDTVANNPATLASIKEDMGAYASYTRADLRAVGVTLFTKVCELTLLPGQPEPCYWYESRYNSRIFSARELNGAPWAVVGLAFEGGGAADEATILSDNGDGTVTVEILALPPLAE